jgi:hypothetical protein
MQLPAISVLTKAFACAAQRVVDTAQVYGYVTFNTPRYRECTCAPPVTHPSYHGTLAGARTVRQQVEDDSAYVLYVRVFVHGKDASFIQTDSGSTLLT